MGQGVWSQAAHGITSESPPELTEEEAAWLAAILPSPQRYDPCGKPLHPFDGTSGPPSHEPEHASSDADRQRLPDGLLRVTACVTVLSLALFGQAIAETPDPALPLYYGRSPHASPGMVVHDLSAQFLVRPTSPTPERRQDA
jgi:hypothetical protein